MSGSSATHMAFLCGIPHALDMTESVLDRLGGLASSRSSRPWLVLLLCWMAASALLRLAGTFGEEDLERLAVSVFRLAYAYLERLPHAVGWLLCALDLHFAPPREVALVGESAELRRAALGGFAPNTVYAFARGEGDPALERIPLLAGKTLVDGRPAAYVCKSFACRMPVTRPAELAAALKEG